MTKTKTNIVTKDEFLARRKDQIKQDWLAGKCSDRQLIDWLLVQGNDSDIEWLMSAFPDPSTL